jgi:hypothetical protein
MEFPINGHKGGTQFIEVLCSGDTFNSLWCNGEDTLKKIWLRYFKKNYRRFLIVFSRVQI